MNKMDKVLSLLSLCARGRNLVSGEFSTEKAVKEGRAELVIVAKDASDITKKMFFNMCSYREIPIYFYAEKETLGRVIGKEMRSSLAVIDMGLAKNVASKLKENNEQEVTEWPN